MDKENFKNKRQDLNLKRDRVPTSKLRPQSMVIINQRMREKEQARLKKLIEEEDIEEGKEHDKRLEGGGTEEGELTRLMKDLDLELGKGGDLTKHIPMGLKIKEKPTSTNVKQAIKLIKANIHTHQPNASNLLWNEDRLIIDFGSLYVKMGFSNNPKPISIWPVYHAAGKPELDYVEKCLGFYEPTLEKLISELGGDFMLYDKVTMLFNCLFRTHLSNAPHRRRALIIENPYMPVKLKQIISQSLFRNHQISSLSFMNSQLASLLSCGESQGIVVDIGNLETTIMSIYDGRPLHSYTSVSPLAGKRVNEHLIELLLLYASIKPSTRYTSHELKYLKFPTKLTREMLSLEALETIKLCHLCVSSKRWEGELIVDSDDFEEKCQARSKAKPTVYNLIYDGVYLDLIIPGWIRDHAYDILFFGDPKRTDDLPPSYLLLDHLLKLPRDLRLPLLTKILLAGGTTAAPGFSYRFNVELYQVINSNPKFESLRPLLPKIGLVRVPKSHVFSPFLMPWVGAAVASEVKAVETGSDKESIVSDWCIGQVAG